jgi:perosamine synthetase
MSNDERTMQALTAAVRREFAFLKGTTTLSQLATRSIPLAADCGALVPVCELHTDDDALIARLSRWRSKNAFAFPTRFPVTDEGTRRWLRNALLDVDDRILFLVCERHGHPVGHLGFAAAATGDGSMEVDNVVRGERGVQPGLMSAALAGLVDWAEEMFLPTRIHLRVFADNTHAIDFYRRNGFVAMGTAPLRRHVDGDRESFAPLAPGDTAPADAANLEMEFFDPIGSGEEQILTAGPSVGAREVSYAADAARTGWNANWSGYLDRLEKTFAEYVGAKYALATSSCTGALHLAVAAAGVGPGDEVIVPELTWVATATAVTYTGGIPVFADVQDDSWCMDPDSVERLITPQTKAIMPVHLYGHPAQVDRIRAIADAHGLRMIEDAAPAIGTELHGRRVGTFGDAAAFSFQGAKLLVTGEGGMLVTNDDELYEQALSLWDHGRDRARGFWIEQLGVKYKMSNLQAAFGLAQLERVDELIEAKRRIFGWYRENLEGLPGITLNHETGWARSIYWMSSIRVGAESGTTKDAVMQALKQRGIDTRPVFTPISQYPIWPRTFLPQRVAGAIGAEGINLPSGVRLRRAQVDRVCREIAHQVRPAASELAA